MNYQDPAGTAFEWVVTDIIAVLLSIVPSFANYVKAPFKGLRGLKLLPFIRYIKDAAEITD